jgi:hypothetical protein
MNIPFSFDIKVKSIGGTVKEYRGNGGKAPLMSASD